MPENGEKPPLVPGSRVEVPLRRELSEVLECWEERAERERRGLPPGDLGEGWADFKLGAAASAVWGARILGDLGSGLKKALGRKSS